MQKTEEEAALMRGKSSKNDKRDANEAEIVLNLRKVGATVELLSPRRGSKGVPDLLVGYRGVNYLLEVKTPEGEVSDDQLEWIECWRGQVVEIRSVGGALKAIGAIRKL
jgi:hypothetical protein